ncbi:MAG: archease [Dehalococcoidales bacterium]|nr:archease [Dehalococcoidales bacterium]
MKKYRLIGHTADIGLEAYGKTMPEAFANAAYGMFAIMTDLRKVRAKTSRRIEIKESDIETLLVEWLNRLIYYFDAEMLLFKRFDIVKFDDTHLTAVCYGEKFDAARHEIKIGVKAATYYSLEIDKERNRVRVIFDI